YAMTCVYVVFHNFVRDHKTLRCTPAEEAGLIKSAMTVSGIVDLIDNAAPAQKKRGHYKPRQPRAAE
ncbi:MAG: IS1 family transposase, partial [Steroidobacteraceae bacterium]